MALVVALVIVFVLLGVLWTAFARDPGPAPADVAIAYETAWDRLDFDLLYDLSGDELRDGLRREQFVAAKRAAYTGQGHDGHLDAQVRVEESVATGQTALVVTKVVTPEGSIRNNVLLEKRAPGWSVVSYSLRS
jgi:hypothetical protein